MLAVAPHLQDATTALESVVRVGAPATGSPKQAIAAVESVERARRLAAVAAVDVLAEIHESRSFYEHGHANAKIMYAHVAKVSGAEAHRLDQIRRMVSKADEINVVWRAADLPVDNAALLAKAYANPRTRDRFLLDQKYFLKKARRFGPGRLTKIVARWLEVNDQDGPDPTADPSFERRKAWMAQDAFSKVWRLEAELGSLQGSTFNQIFKAYVEAEFAKDWAAAEREHGADTCRDDLARTDQQRCADALCQIAEDAANSDKPSAPVKRVHNIVWAAETWEEYFRRYINAPARILDPDTYYIADIDGHPLDAQAAFADSLVSTVRRVVANAAGVTVNMSADTRLFTGLARLGVQLSTDECYWPGCHIPTSRSQIDHLRPAARGGQTEQCNGGPACPRHNRFKERGYTVTRQPDGTYKITTPTGELIR